MFSNRRGGGGGGGVGECPMVVCLNLLLSIQAVYHISIILLHTITIASMIMYTINKIL